MLDTSYRKSHVPKIAVINADDPSAEYFASFPADRIVRYGIQNGDFLATNVMYRPDATQFMVKGKDQVLPAMFKTSLVGEFNVYNCLAAIETCFTLPINSGSILDGVENFTSIPGRMERINEGQDFTAMVDFAQKLTLQINRADRLLCDTAALFANQLNAAQSLLRCAAGFILLSRQLISKIADCT